MAGWIPGPEAIWRGLWPSTLPSPKLINPTSHSAWPFVSSGPLWHLCVLQAQLFLCFFFPVLSIQNNTRVLLQLTRMMVSWSVAGIMHCMLSGLIPGWQRLVKGAETSVILEDCTERREPCLGIVLRRTSRRDANQSPAASEQLNRLDMTGYDPFLELLLGFHSVNRV